jgi:transcriptional/translational regulatory protein YebC/TACO1
MSGHNKWSKIKRKKEVADKEKSKVFSRYIKAISDAAKQNPNPEANTELKRVIEQAKENNVPKNNIENALRKALETAEKTKEIQLEAYGPAGIAILIIADTDNQQRTIQKIKSILNDIPEAKWADPGSVTWAFEKNNQTGKWKAKFPQEINKEDRKKLKNLVDKIKENEDVTEVYTSSL